MLSSRPRVRRAQLRDALIYWILVPAAVIGAGFLFDLLLGLSPFSFRPEVLIVGLGLIVAGVALIQKATRDFTRFGQGTPNPKDPPRRLVREGVYGLCRHPMFFGYDLAALGIVLLVRSPGMILFSVPLFFTIQVVFLRKEERRLMKRFGKEYVDYRSKTPFLVPRRWKGVR